MVRRRWLVPLLTVLPLACGPVDDPPPLASPFNRCPDHPCEAYDVSGPKAACRAGICEVKQQIVHTLVVNVPTTSPYAPGQTFAIASSDLFTRTTPKCRPPSCVVLPRLVEVAGDLVVNAVGEGLLGRSLASGADLTSIPVRVVLWPLWPGGETNRPTDAALVGLPLDPIVGRTRARTEFVSPPGPGGGPSVEYRASVPSGAYAREVVPLPPYDGFVPPDFHEGFAPEDYRRVEIGATPSTVDAFTFPLSRAAGELRGWKAAFVDEATGRRVSSVLTLKGPPEDGTLRLLNRPVPDPRKLDLVLSPPESEDALPLLSYEFVAGATPPIVYPALPPAVRVEGTVGGQDGAIFRGVAATLDFESTDVRTATPGDVPANLKLRFLRRVATDAAGAYAVRLPPGSYKVAITPRDPLAPSPGTSVSPPRTLFARVVSQDVRVAPEPAVQKGRLLQLRSAFHVKGTCRLADGRPLVGAVVEVRAAAALTRPPLGPSARTSPGSASPRPNQTTTDGEGAFDLPVDPGNYDLTVKPAGGTRLPWIVVTGRYYGGEDLDVGTLVVPPPIPAGLTLHEPASDSPVRRAVVRAFAVPTSGTVAALVGEAMTDDEGHWTLDLAGYPR